VQTEVQRERTAVEHLQRAGFVTYVPRIKIKKHGIERTPPLFPTYVFVQIERRWHDARWSPGVVRLLMDGDQPAKLQDCVMEEIRSREVGGFVKLKPPPKARKGERVRINGGRFDGHVGLYEGQTARERQRVLLEILGAWCPVELGAGDQVEVIPGATHKRGHWPNVRFWRAKRTHRDGGNDANDPEPTLAEFKSRNATVSPRTPAGAHSG